MSSGVYAQLENAVKGQVVTRFPPEASGYLHIGHAKAALLNYYYKQIYEGKLILRFDDTNPEKENVEFEKVIVDDLKDLDVQYDIMTYTSDHFETLLNKCRKMIELGKAYVDDTPADQMKIEREQRLESKCRSQSVEENLTKWQEMIIGSEAGKKCCVRAIIDFASKNGCMRDPTMYRVKDEPHPRFGDKYKVYPTYDFACPLVDSIEGVTHALRTSEYIDRDPQYYWFLDALGMRKPIISSYSRLNMMNTILSKRKLTWLVEEKYVEGWNDPRMPTVQGILRRGLTVDGLKQFILSQGSSKAIVFMEWDKIWAINKKVLDPIVPRYTSIVSKDFVTLILTNQNDDEKMDISIALHPKDTSMGNRTVRVSKYLIIEQEDALVLKETETATLLGLGNVKIIKINKNENNLITSIDAVLDLEDKNYKKTPKVTWLSKDNVAKAKLVYYDHIITKSVLGKDEDFKTYVNKNAKSELDAFTEPELFKDVKTGDIIQYQRKGNFKIDGYSDDQVVLIYIPDGTSKNPNTSVVASSGKKPKESTSNNKDTKVASSGAKIESSDTKQGSSEPKQQQKQEKKQQQKEKKSEKPPKEKKPSQQPKPSGDQKVNQGKKQTKLGIEAKKEEDFASWYTEVITRGEMIEYYDVSGCYIFRPGSYSIWERIQAYFDKKIKSIGVENCYFPMFVSKQALETEKDHIADFAPEVAWVTRSGKSELTEPIAIRPTSETVMYPAFAKWTQSHRDLPIKLNQWNNVVRWEFKDPTPFIRTREFLWQEGHSAFAELDQALEEVSLIQEYYAQIYEDLLAIPVVRGKKSEKEKFPGADFTLTVEGYIGTSGRGIQGATSHHLGQNFSKMFNISFQDPADKSQRKFAYQNSWGLSTRTIGVLIMVHSDNKGLVLPPKVNPTQVVIIPVGITVSTSPEMKETLYGKCSELNKALREIEVRSIEDKDDHNTPGWKFNRYELKGVCIRIEIGPKDLEKGQLVACRRDTGEKVLISFETALEEIPKLLQTIQADLYAKAKHEMDTHRAQVTEWEDFIENLNRKFTLLAPFCGKPSCEDNIKKDSVREEASASGGAMMGAKSLCIPLNQPKEPLDNLKCIYPTCQAKPEFWCLFGRSY